MATAIKPTRPDLAALNSGLVSKEVLKALEVLTPLGGAFDCPEPRRLGPFWSKVEAAIQSIDPSTIHCAALNVTAIQALGMYLLGDAAWAVIQPSLDSTTTWRSFKALVEA